MSDERFRFGAVKLCGLLGAVFAFQVFSNFELGFRASEPVYWRFFTSFFAHSDLEHLLNNLFFIGLFGSMYEAMTSQRAMAGTFLASAVFANFSAFIFFQDSILIGASGGAFGLLAAAAVYRPNSPALALGVPMPMWAGLLLYTLVNLVGITGAGNVAHEAHLLGIVAGALIGLQLRGGDRSEEKEEDFSDWRSRIREWERKYMID
jgi:membrane associated rhomboid family serine protease